MSDRTRAEQIETFQNGERKVMLATTRTGGVGITLTRASTAIFVDRDWSPAVNQQAEDRLHRIGAKSAVQIILLQARDTVDQAVEETLNWKASTIRKMLGG